MATLYVENVPDDIYKALRERARKNHTSIAAEVIGLLKDLCLRSVSFVAGASFLGTSRNCALNPRLLVVHSLRPRKLFVRTVIGEPLCGRCRRGGEVGVARGKRKAGSRSCSSARLPHNRQNRACGPRPFLD